MLFRFRICRDPEIPDMAQGWVVADSEVAARHLLVVEAQLTLQSRSEVSGAPDGTIFVTEGKLP